MIELLQNLLKIKSISPNDMGCFDVIEKELRELGFSCERINTKPPNILWITVEDISPNLGCYGDNKAHTPTLDGLAAKGFKYINAIANAPVCAPARNSIITGMYPSSLGTLDMRSSSKPWMKRSGWVPDDILMYPEVLSSKGYYCTNNTKEDYNLDLKREIWDHTGKEAHWKNRPQEDTPFFWVPLYM